ncbi:MAG: hypothetical protein WCK54_06785 [Desulfuromonadales bacterium]
MRVLQIKTATSNVESMDIDIDVEAYQAYHDMEETNDFITRDEHLAGMFAEVARLKQQRENTAERRSSATAHAA